MNRPSSCVAVFMLANAAVAGAAWLSLDWMRATRFDPAGKYAAAGLFFAATLVIFAFAARRLQVGLLFTFVAMSAAFNVAVSHTLIAIAGGSIVKGAAPLSAEHLFMYGIEVVFVAFCYLLLLAMAIMALVTFRVSIASPRLAAILGIDTPAQES